MKTLKLIGLLTVLILQFPISKTFAQDKKAEKKAKKEQQFREIVKLVEARTFRFEGSKAYPQGFRPVDLTTNYNFTNVNDSVAEASMPFFGRAFNAAYGGDGGMKFEGKMEEIEFAINEKKQSVLLQFKVRGENDTYRVSIDVGYSGSANMNITSNNRSFISYSGDVMPLPSEKEE